MCVHIYMHIHTYTFLLWSTYSLYMWLLQTSLIVSFQDFGLHFYTETILYMIGPQKIQVTTVCYSWFKSNRFLFMNPVGWTQKYLVPRWERETSGSQEEREGWNNRTSYRLDNKERSQQFISSTQKGKGELRLGSSWEIQAKEAVCAKHSGVQKHSTFRNLPVVYIAKA